MPLSNFLTRRTWAACSSIVRFLWITPMPPSWAMAMAMAPSVTVSMAALMSGMCSEIWRVKRAAVRVAPGSTCE